MADCIERFPLFPLGLVLLPGEVIPLHIFEERYKLMIGECLERETPFGILWLADEGLQDVGCTAAVTQLLERMDDGRMNILVQGERPFQMLRKIEDMSYPAGDIELLDDRPGEPDPEAGTAARRRYADLVERATDSRPSEDDLEQLDSYGMAATLNFALDAKQDLLRLRSEPERLARLSELFEQAMERLDHAERVAERAQGNGRFSHS